jgi:chromosome partitioning protein
MSAVDPVQSSARVIVVGNEKGGSGKSTVAMHIAVALLKQDRRVATIDLDTSQRTFTRYIQNRRVWAEHIGRELGVPHHGCFDELPEHPTAEEEEAQGTALSNAIASLSQDYDYVVIDTPGHNSYLARTALSLADTLITPLNDSFVDLDVLGTVEPETLHVVATSNYAKLVERARAQREERDGVSPEWIVFRNRLSMTNSRNKRCVGEGLQELSQRLGFRYMEGLAERLIFREFYPRGLTALDTLDPITLGTRPTLSHATARLELENLVNALRLDGTVGNEQADRHAA